MYLYIYKITMIMTIKKLKNSIDMRNTYFITNQNTYIKHTLLTKKHLKNKEKNEY